MTVCASNYTDF